MYKLDPKVKHDPQKRWALPDRIFFGHGACPILAGVYLLNPPREGFYAVRIIPKREMFGNHIFVTNGSVSFDYHGYSTYNNLLRHHIKGWSKEYKDWDYYLEKVDFDLLSTSDLNDRKMMGPDQYLHDPIPRAKNFISQFNHTDRINKIEIDLHLN